VAEGFTVALPPFGRGFGLLRAVQCALKQFLPKKALRPMWQKALCARRACDLLQRHTRSNRAAHSNVRKPNTKATTSTGSRDRTHCMRTLDTRTPRARPRQNILLSVSNIFGLNSSLVLQTQCTTLTKKKSNFTHFSNLTFSNFTVQT